MNPLGIKGIGELGTVGMNAAVANAVYHATGRARTRAADPSGEASVGTAAGRQLSGGALALCSQAPWRAAAAARGCE